MWNLPKESLTNFVLVLKSSAAIVLLLLLCLFINIYFFMPDLAELLAKPTIQGLVKLNAFLIIYVFVYILTLLIVGYELIGHECKTFMEYCKSRSVKLSTDLTKSYNKILLFSLLLILPGIYHYIRLIFVPFASMEFAESKDDDQPNSMEYSNKLTKAPEAFFILFLVYLLFVPLDLVWGSVSNDSILTTLFLSLLSLSPILYHCAIFSIYKEAKRELT